MNQDRNTNKANLWARVWFICCNTIVVILAANTAYGIENTWLVGIDGRYNLMARTEDGGPAGIHGGGLGAFLNYSVTDSIRVNLSGDLNWYQTYEIVNEPISDEIDDEGTVPDPTDETSEDELDRIPVTGIRTGSLALSAEYVIDVMRVLPFFGLGMIVLRNLEQVDEKWALTTEIGFRVSLGFDYMLLDAVGLGIVLHSDNYFLEEASYVGLFSMMVRATVCFDFGRVGFCHGQV